MSKVVVVNHVSLDGVMQAPARPDEDTRGGFTHGGWGLPNSDAVIEGEMGKRMARSGSLLFGRRTYLDLYAVWPSRTDNPYTPALNNAQKYVASTTLEEPLPWINSTLLKGDTADAVAHIKEQPGKDIVILGSGELIQSLMPHNLIDEFVLLIHPVVLGTGRRLFPDDSAFTALQLVNTVTATTGVIIATYQVSEPLAQMPG